MTERAAPRVRPLLRGWWLRTEAETRSALRLLSPRTIARILIAVTWTLCAMSLLKRHVVEPPGAAVPGAGSWADGWVLDAVTGIAMVVVLLLLFVPARGMLWVYLAIAVLSPVMNFTGVAGAATRDDAIASASTLVLLPVFAFVLWGIRMGCVATFNALVSVTLMAQQRLIPLPLVAALGVVVVATALLLGWAISTAERLDHDDVTALPNRRSLDRRLESELARGPGGPPPALALIDVDGLARLNRDRGRAGADLLLCSVAATLLTRADDDAYVYHLGAGRFAVLHRRPTGQREFVESLRRDLGPGITASAGLAGVRPVDSASLLVLRAESSLARAKDAGGDRIDPVVLDDALVHDLEAAVQQGQLTVVYQPIVDLVTGRTASAEALVRWDHPTRGRIAPDAFISISEETGLIHSVGRFVLERACRESAHAVAAGRPLDRVSVNASAIELRRRGYVDMVVEVLRATGLPANRLQLEITESSIATADPAVVDALTSLRDLGVRVALDDFGTGYSSLAVLGTLPVDVLKIDKSFVWADPGDVRDSVLSAILSLAGVFELVTVAEGVETWDQAEDLALFGCTLGQGYLFGRPGAFGELDLAPRPEDPRVPRQDPSRGRFANQFSWAARSRPAGDGDDAPG